MSTQISLKLSNKMLEAAKKHTNEKGYDNLQDFIRELIREKLFEEDEITGVHTFLASHSALAKDWLSKEEDNAWKHLQKEK